jgi:CO/xanthine dehydrogenase Mo-binding subunit
MTHFSWIPEIETVLIDNPELAPQGCGEPTITCMAALIANALFDATGVRFFRLPLTPKGLHHDKFVMTRQILPIGCGNSGLRASF